jgi:hypothetical protein
MNNKQNGGGYDNNITIITFNLYNDDIYNIDKNLINSAKEEYDKSIDYDTKTKIMSSLTGVAGLSSIGYVYKDQLKDLSDNIKEGIDSVGDLF